jgi:hypothetical protein
MDNGMKYKMEHYSSIKKKEILSFRTLVELDIIKLNEINQSLKNIWNLKR